MDENINVPMSESEFDDTALSVIPGGVYVLIHWLAVLLSTILNYFDKDFVPLAGNKE